MDFSSRRREEALFASAPSELPIRFWPFSSFFVCFQFDFDRFWMICLLIRLFVVDRFGMDDYEVEEEIRPDFPCPYCYEDHDITSLCTHLEDEHSFESNVAVRFAFSTEIDSNICECGLFWMAWVKDEIFVLFLISIANNLAYYASRSMDVRLQMDWVLQRSYLMRCFVCG